MGKVVVIEDAEAIGVSLSAALSGAGHTVLTRSDGRRLEHDLAEFCPDVVVLDVMLPGRDGFALLSVVRARCAAAVLMLTARNSVDDRLRGLTGGADDYVVKPFVLAEVVARVNVLMRRVGAMSSTVTVGDLVVDPDTGTARRADEPITLTPTEFKLLCHLAEHRGKILSKAQLLSAVWGFDATDPNLVEVHISALRRKLDENRPPLLHTKRGFGYVLRPDPS